MKLTWFPAVVTLLLLFAYPIPAASLMRLRREFQKPPSTAQSWAYWWWLDSAASREGITADFEAMRKQGISGVLLFDAGEGGTNAPKGPLFMSEPWRKLFRHSLREADRLGITVGVNLCSGWNAGGTWVTPELAAKKLVWSETTIDSSSAASAKLPQPPTIAGFYRDIVIVAMPFREGMTNQIARLEVKAGRDYAKAPSQRELADGLSENKTEDSAQAPACRLTEVQVLTNFLAADGTLSWHPPAGRWVVLRFGYTLLGSRTKCTSPGSQGYEIDFFSREAFDDHYAHTGKPLLEDARSARAKSLKYFHVDSYESGNPSWSPGFADEFRTRRGYELWKWLPVLTGRVVETDELSHRFLWDIRRTIGDLYAENYYGRLAELSHRDGIGIHPESSGPFWAHIDALQCAGMNDIPMTEFWKRRDENKEWVWWLTGTEAYCDLIKQAASAAHVYGLPICQAEAYTTMGPNWEEDPFTMKDIGDRAFCAGLTRNVLCFWVHQADVNAFPGFQWEAAGTHFDSHITWWNMSQGWLTYLSRCQYLLRQGRFAADFCYFYGEDVPNYVPARSHMDPPLPPGFDCDVINADVLMNRLTAANGLLKLPDSMAYRYLVLPHRDKPSMSHAVLRRIAELARQGASVIGSAPQHAPGLSGWPECDSQVRSLARELWGENPGPSGERKFGKGRIIWGPTPAEVVAADHLLPDVEFSEITPARIEPRFDGVKVPLEWIHRRDGDRDLYFVANITSQSASARVTFRTTGRAPELWDPVTGKTQTVPQRETNRARTTVPLQFAPKQSFFIVFPEKARKASLAAKPVPDLSPLVELSGPWQVSFDPNWGGPQQITFEQLTDWTKRTEDGIRYYSGTATYRKTFDLPSRAGAPASLYLDLGKVKNLARVQLNGKDLGIIWTAPWEVEITQAAREGPNDLVIEVVNLWPNRLIGDAKLPKAERKTRTNVRKFEKPGQQLLESGLMGPVRVLRK